MKKKLLITLFLTIEWSNCLYCQIYIKVFIKNVILMIYMIMQVMNYKELEVKFLVRIKELNKI
ncbi:Uncharacterised protein [Mycobacteroides abscessus subsp. abscessus]|nr:Uncharacterised protein [Mycobacteroides abscessus subsp. abscessus]